MTIKSSGTLAASEIGYEFGRIVGQSVSFDLNAPSGAVIRGVEPGTTGAFSSYYGKTSAKSLKVYSSPELIAQVQARIDRRLDWYVNFKDFSTRIYGATSAGAIFDNNTSFLNTRFGTGVEPLFVPNVSYYDSLYVDTSGTTSSRGSTWVAQNVSILQQPVSYSTSYGEPWSSVVRGDDSGQPSRSTFTLSYRAVAGVNSDKGGFYNPRIWFNRTFSHVMENDTNTYYIPIVKDPDVSIVSISFFVVNSTTQYGGPQALQVTAQDTGGVWIRNRYANGVDIGNYSFGIFDFDFRNSGTNLAASWLRCNATLRYQNYNHNVTCDHFIHFTLGPYQFPPAIDTGGG